MLIEPAPVEPEVLPAGRGSTHAVLTAGVGDGFYGLLQTDRFGYGSCCERFFHKQEVSVKYVMMTTVVAAVLAGSVLGCDNKAKEEQKAAAQPANAADASAMAKKDQTMTPDNKVDTATSNMKTNAAATTPEGRRHHDQHGHRRQRQSPLDPVRAFQASVGALLESQRLAAGATYAQLGTLAARDLCLGLRWVRPSSAREIMLLLKIENAEHLADAYEAMQRFDGMNPRAI